MPGAMLASVVGYWLRKYIDKVKDKKNILALIGNAFAGRQPPDSFFEKESYLESEYPVEAHNEILSIRDMHWSDISCELLDRYYDIDIWLSSEAFIYYLPGILTAGIKQDNHNLLVYSHIIGNLDRMPVPEYWDDYFLRRWPLLTIKELEAVEEWVFWIKQRDAINYYPNTFDRVYATLTLLKKRQMRNGS